MKIAVRFVSIVFLVFLFSLLALHYSLFTGSAYAEPDPPDPKPCVNALETNALTRNVIDPLSFTVSGTGVPGAGVQPEQTVIFNVDFSKLQAIFAKPSSDYLESRFQDEPHRNVDILSLESKDFNSYHGPGQKAAPKVMVDQLKVRYVQYVYNKPTLAESANKYADIEGENPKTIYELVGLYQLPDEDPDTPQPTPPSLGGDEETWQNSWAKYWEKIPTAVSEFYFGKLLFFDAAGQTTIQQFEQGQANSCPLPLRTVYFVLPEFGRTTGVASQVNQVIVPKAAQSAEKNLLATTTNGTKAAFSKIVKKCFDTLSQTPLSKALKKAVKIGLNFLKPVKAVYAQEDWCNDVTVLRDKKEGSAPFCSVPEKYVDDWGDLVQNVEPGECRDLDDPNKLDRGTNVICTFKLTWRSSHPLIIGQTGPDQWDRCNEPDPDTGEQTCSLDVKIWPEFRIPWLAEIWNNTTYSDEKDAHFTLGTEQKTGKPGVYTFFKPKSADEAIFPKGKNLSGEQEKPDPNELKQRFLGATDCNKEFARDIALKPKALQEALGIESDECNLLAAIPPGPTPGPGPGPGPGSDCGGRYDASNSPQGNFGDPDCDFSSDALARYLRSLDSSEWEKYFNIAFVEGGYSFQPNAYNPAASNGTAWGLFQMDEGDNGQHDQGHVSWRDQASNAVAYNDQLPSSERWCYWGAAYLDYLGYCPRWLADL